MLKSEYQEIVLVDEDYFTSLLDAIDQAKRTIDMETYIFEEGRAGKQTASALCRAAKRGVKIRVLLDGIGSMYFGGELKKQLEDANIRIKIFHPLPWKISHWASCNLPKANYLITNIISFLAKINSRNHRKMCIIDSHIVFVGSANITNHLIDDDKEKKWREMSVKLINVNTDEIQYAFNKAWGGVPFRKRLKKRFQKINDVIFRLNYSWKLRHKFYKAFLNKISRSKQRIWVTSAYFLPNEFILKKLIQASRRKIDVRILLPSKSDIFMMPIATTSFYEKLLKNRVSVYEYFPSILHAKILIIDDWFSIGSSNLNNRSFKHDLEVDVNIQSPQAKKTIEDQFLYDLGQSNQIHLKDFKKQSFLKKIIAKIILLLRYWL